MPMPLFQPTTNIQKISRPLLIPKCTEQTDVRTTKTCKEILVKQRKKKQRHRKKKRKIEERSKRKENSMVLSRQPESSLLLHIVVVLAVVLVVIIIGFAIFIYVWMYKRQNSIRYQECHQKKDQQARLLILVNSIEEDPFYHKAANVLASMLGGEHFFNLWQLSIKEHEDWIANRLQRCHHVVFICTPTGKRRCDKFMACKGVVVDAFIAGVYRYVRDTEKVRATAVYFDGHARLCVPESLSHHVKQFQITEKYNKFVQHIKNNVFVPQRYSELDQLKDIVENIRSVESTQCSSKVEHAFHDCHYSMHKHSSIPTVCSSFDEVKSINDKNEVVCRSLEKDSGIF